MNHRHKSVRIEQTVLAVYYVDATDDYPSQKIEMEFRLPNFNREVLWMTFLIALWGGVIGIGYFETWYWLCIAGGLAFIFQMISLGVFMFNSTAIQRYDVNIYKPEPEPGPEPDVLDPSMVTIPIDVDTAAIFKQPHVAAFAAWSKLVIADMFDRSKSERAKVTFSQNTGTKRKWPKPMHQLMVAELSTMHLMYRGPNNVPTLTDKGVRAIEAWMRMQGQAGVREGEE